MDLITYQPLARRTMKELPTFRQHVEHMTLGINGELGEIADALKKFMIYGKGVDPADRKKDLAVADGGILDLVNLSEEGGDAWWYIVGLTPELGDTAKNLAALQAGYDNGYAMASGLTSGPVALITQMQVQAATVTLDLLGFDAAPSENIATASLNILGRNMGLFYGHYGLLLADSLEANIAKLAKRYGDKYSDVAALNRDTAAERQVLDASLVKTAKPKAKDA